MSNFKYEQYNHFLCSASVYIVNGQFEEGIKETDKAIALIDSDSRAYYDRGYAKMRLGLFEASLIDFALALAFGSVDPYVLRYLSNSLYSLREYKGALAIANKVVEKLPEKISFFDRASIKKAMGDIKGSEEDEENASTADYACLPF